MIRPTNEAIQLSRSFRTRVRVAGSLALAVIALITAGLFAGITQVPANATGIEATPTPEPGIVRAYRVLTTPVIDGNLADWPLLGGLVLNTDTAYSYNGSFSSYADGSTTCWSQWTTPRCSSLVMFSTTCCSPTAPTFGWTIPLS